MSSDHLAKNDWLGVHTVRIKEKEADAKKARKDQMPTKKVIMAKFGGGRKWKEAVTIARMKAKGLRGHLCRVFLLSGGCKTGSLKIWILTPEKISYN